MTIDATPLGYFVMYIISSTATGKVEAYVHFVHTAQVTTLLSTYGGHWRPLHVAVTYWNSAPFVLPSLPDTVSGLTSTQSNDDR